MVEKTLAFGQGLSHGHLNEDLRAVTLGGSTVLGVLVGKRRESGVTALVGWRVNFFLNLGQLVHEVDSNESLYRMK